MPAYFATRRAERQRLARYFSRATFHAYGIDDDFSTGRLPRRLTADGFLHVLCHKRSHGIIEMFLRKREIHDVGVIFFIARNYRFTTYRYECQ